MAEETWQPGDVVASVIRLKLQQEGGLEDLLKLVGTVGPRYHSGFKSTIEGADPVPVGFGVAESMLSGEAHVVVTPVAKAEGHLIPTEIIDAIRLTSPELASEIQARSPQDAIQTMNLIIALINLVAALVTLYIATHPAAPVTPQQITQFFDQSVHIVNQTTVVNLPPPHGAG